jgi:hypothetical protein
MAKRRHSQTLREDRKKGGKLPHTTVNTMIRRTKRDINIGHGWDEETFMVTEQRDKSVSEWIQFQTDDLVPMFSIFGIVGQGIPTWEDQPTRVKIAKIGITEPGSHVLPFTNDATEIPGGAFGYARALAPFEVTKVAVTGQTPLVGWPCGPHLDGWGVCGDRYGFLCLAQYTDHGSAYADVMLSREPCSVVGTVVTAITAYDPRDKVLGIGAVQVRYRVNDGRELQKANDPQTTYKPWILPVFNVCEESFPVGVEVKANECMGVGLVVDPCYATYSSGSVSVESESASQPSSSVEPPGPWPPCPGWTGDIEVLVADPKRTGDEIEFPMWELHFEQGVLCSIEHLPVTRVYVCCGSSEGPTPSSAQSSSWAMSSPFAWYKLDDDEANTTVDDAIAGDDAVASQNTENLSAAGKIDKCFDFDDASVVDKGAFNELSVDYSWSVAFWMKRDPAESGMNALVYQCIDATDRWWIAFSGSEVIANAYDGSNHSVRTTSGIVYNTWHHIAVTWDGPTTTIKIYLDGVEKTGAYDWAAPLDADHFCIGAAYDSNYYNNFIDDVRLYDTVLDQDAIDWLYNGGSGRSEES